MIDSLFKSFSGKIQIKTKNENGLNMLENVKEVKKCKIYNKVKKKDFCNVI